MIEPRVIVGAGLAGSAAALLLARAGQPPLLLERTASVRPRLCGEFVSAEATQILLQLGVDVLALGGRPTRRLRLASGRDLIEAELPFTAVGLTRHALDGALQQQAASAGARLLRGHRVAVQRVATTTEPFELALSEGRNLHCATLLLATGKTDLAPLARRPQRPPEPLVGLRLHLRLAPTQARAIEGHVEVLLTADGYAGLQPVEGDKVNLCLLLQRESAGARPEALLQMLRSQSPLLAERLEGAVTLPEAPEMIYRVPYGYLHRAHASDPPGLWRLGDQAAVIPSFTGDGMAIALHSATLAVAMLLEGTTAARYHRQLHADVAAQVGRALWLYRLGRRPWGRGLLLRLLRTRPQLLGFIAAMTRVPASALRL
ncbi:MAG: NAD(P)-binding protein [Pseudomonadota bacterium]|nr:NAD(P)-binding protein [Pseudomonadota bacterium]